MLESIEIKSEARDNKRLTSKQNKGEEALHSKNDKKEMLASIKIKGKVREPEWLTLHHENTADARPNVCKAHGRYEGDGVPNSNSKRTYHDLSEKCFFESGDDEEVRRPRQPVRRQ